MNKNNNQVNLWLGLLFAAVGALIMLVSLDVIHSPEENFHAPRWVVLVAGMSFFGAGVYASLSDPRFDVLKEEAWFRFLLGIALAVMPISLLVVLNWVAFGGGEREFSGSVSVPFFSISTENSGQIMGRCVFGSAAVISDLVLIFFLVKAAVKWVSRDEKDD
ncbi:MAG TPA: hypothetical protein VJ965_07720 [Anaerolineales bacterium]|nr:hypothetical protein [Anaerolineales bacterium]